MNVKVFIAEGAERDFSVADGSVVRTFWGLAVTLQVGDNILTDRDLHEALAEPHEQVIDLLLNRFEVEPTHNCIRLLLSDLCRKFLQHRNVRSHLLYPEGRVQQMGLTLFTERFFQFTVS